MSFFASSGRAFLSLGRSELPGAQVAQGTVGSNRRVGTCYDKLATSFQAFINLAIIRRYLRHTAPYDPSDRT